MAPAHTVTTGWWAMASRSAETSPVISTPRCTPPMPPVANTRDAGGRGQGDRRRHGRRPERPSAGRWPPGTSRSAALRAGPRMRSCSAGSMPTRGRPSSTAVTAGTAPAGADGAEAALERLGVGRRRQPEVGEDRRLQGHDGPARRPARRRPRARRRARSRTQSAVSARVKRLTTSTWVVCGNVSTTSERSWW